MEDGKVLLASNLSIIGFTQYSRPRPRDVKILRNSPENHIQVLKVVRLSKKTLQHLQKCTNAHR